MILAVIQHRVICIHRGYDNIYKSSGKRRLADVLYYRYGTVRHIQYIRNRGALG